MALALASLKVLIRWRVTYAMDRQPEGRHGARWDGLEDRWRVLESVRDGAAAE
jgi:hypothetical protein